MIKDGALAELKRTLTSIARLPLEDPRSEHEDFAMQYLEDYGRCMVVGADLTGIGYPRPLWAARAINMAHHWVQREIHKASQLEAVLADRDPRAGGIKGFILLLEDVFDNRMRAWLVEVAAQHSLERSIEERGVINRALHMGLSIFKKDCRVYDKALHDHAGYIQAIDCGGFAHEYRESIAVEYDGSLPWWLAGGLEAHCPCNILLRPKFQAEASQHGKREA